MEKNAQHCPEDANGRRTFAVNEKLTGNAPSRNVVFGFLICFHEFVSIYLDILSLIPWLEYIAGT